MINIDRFKQAFDMLLKRNSKGASSPKEFTQAVNMSQRECFSDRYGNPREYMNGKAVPRTGGGQRNKKISGDLRPFLQPPVVVVKSTGNKFLYPSDLAFPTAIYYILTDGTYKECKLVTDDELSTILDSSIIVPTLTNPIYVEYNDNFVVYPATIAKVSLAYYRNPPDAIWAYTTDVNGRVIYDATNSIDLLWNDQMFNELLMKTASTIGLNLKDVQVIQYAEQQQNKGV